MLKYATVEVSMLVVEPSWLTLIVCDETLLPETVIVALRGLVLVLAAAVTVKLPLFEPDAGLTVSHDAELVTFQVVLLVTVTVLFPPSLLNDNVLGETERL